ncbi:hypothetical protein EVAR_55393_1 [Eumeta japonica]|uniref:Uncharacterized protein n=1 Tax=Eumeta variegata TaxID=151549 RepID=A0A4C1YSV6_EUMVA|nr:hypothetical protein EVAR_55393_1 [Eumeta japonica]
MRSRWSDRLAGRSHVGVGAGSPTGQYAEGSESATRRHRKKANIVQRPTARVVKNPSWFYSRTDSETPDTGRALRRPAPPPSAPRRRGLCFMRAHLQIRTAYNRFRLWYCSF